MTEVEKLIKALQAGAKTKSELEPRLHFRSVVKNVVDRARKKGFTITYSEGRYSLQNHDSTIQV
jgi:ribosomal protein S3